MRFPPVHAIVPGLLLTAALAAVGACNRDLGLRQPADLSAPSADLSAPPPDLAAPLDQTALPDLTVLPCALLDGCDCLGRRDCTAIGTPCFAPVCQPPYVSICHGGRYLGCAPATSRCAERPCGVAYPAVGPDASGCFSCGPLTCDSGLASLRANCNFPSGWLDGLACTRNPGCIATCMAGLAHGGVSDLLCDDVGCAFCSTCDCAGNTAFSTCVAACIK
jgi:hypothetical protein